MLVWQVKKVVFSVNSNVYWEGSNGSWGEGFFFKFKQDYGHSWAVLSWFPHSTLSFARACRQSWLLPTLLKAAGWDLLINKCLLGDLTETVTVNSKVFVPGKFYSIWRQGRIWGCQHCISANSYRHSKGHGRATLEREGTFRDLHRIRELPFIPHNVIINLHEGCCCIEFAQISIW